MVVVCSQPHTTFVLLSTVCLHLPATVFTPQGDHVIRSPPLDHLSSCSTTPPEKEKKENNINRQEHTTSNVHHLLAQSLLYHHYSLRNHTRLIGFFFSVPPTQCLGGRETSPSSRSTYLTYYCFTLYPLHCILLHMRSLIPTPTFTTITCYSKKYCHCHIFFICLI